MHIQPNKLSRRILLAVCLLVCSSCWAAPLPTITWLDDFLGIALDAKYSKVTSGGAKAEINNNSVSGNFGGGALLLSAFSSGAGNARVRLGEDGGTGTGDFRNWSAQKNLVYRARAFLNTATFVQATIGFVGQNDPQNVLAAIYNSRSSTAATWQFEARANGNASCAAQSTAFTHTPGTWFEVRIEVQTSPSPVAILFVNDTEYQRLYPPCIPSSFLAPEFQVWNASTGSGYSQPSMWIDYLYITQDR